MKIKKSQAAAQTPVKGRDKKYAFKMKAKKYSVSIIRAALLFGLCFMIIQPMIIRFATSIMVETDLYDSTIVLLPRNVTLDNYRIVAELTDLKTVNGAWTFRSLWNTLWISLLVSVCQIIACTLVGYGFARYDFPFKKFWFACVILLIIVPPQTIQTSLIVHFATFDILGIIKLIAGHPLNLRGSVLPYVLMSLTCMGLKDGLYIYMLRQYFRGIPKSLEEAAYVDGCSTLRTFCEIMLPDAVPTIASCFLFSFVWQWTDLFYSRNFLSSYSLYSTQLSGIISRMGMYFNAGRDSAQVVPNARQQQLVFVGVLICCIPLIILYCFTQRTFVESIAMSGSKE